MVAEYILLLVAEQKVQHCENGDAWVLISFLSLDYCLPLGEHQTPLDLRASSLCEAKDGDGELQGPVLHFFNSDSTPMMFLGDRDRFFFFFFPFLDY